MAKKNVKVFSDFMKAISPTGDFIVSYSFGEDQNFDVQVKNYMTLDEKATFIDRVVNGCFDDNDDFHPELKDAVFQITILQMLTNASVFTTKVDEVDFLGNSTGEKIEVIDVDKTYNLCKCLNLYEKCQNEVFRSLYDELSYLVDGKIIFRQQRILMGEKKMLEKTMAEMETGIAMINGISDQLTDTLKEGFQNTNAINATNNLVNRMENMSDKQLLEVILNK